MLNSFTEFLISVTVFSVSEFLLGSFPNLPYLLKNYLHCQNFNLLCPWPYIYICFKAISKIPIPKAPKSICIVCFSVFFLILSMVYYKLKKYFEAYNYVTFVLKGFLFVYARCLRTLANRLRITVIKFLRPRFLDC